MSLLSAITQDSVLANMVVEGGVDAAVFEHFVHEVLKHLRSKEGHEKRPIVLLMDNASVHQHRAVVELAVHYHAHVLYSAQYSPWLNPVEAYFWRLKRVVGEQATEMR